MRPTSSPTSPTHHPLPNGLVADYPRALESARQVQQNLFPCRLPRVAGWDFAAACRPALQVGGDYADLFEVGPGRVAVALGDVSGKGLGPALVMAQLHALVRGRLPLDPGDLGRFMADLNARFRDCLPQDWFVSLFLALLDVDTGRLRDVNAGHPAALVLPGEDGAPLRLTCGGPVLGVLPGAVYEEGETALEPGSVLALFSDGVTEVAAPGGRMFGEAGVLGVLRAARPAAAAAVLGQLLEAVEGCAGGAEQLDDLSAVIVRRTADASAMDPDAEAA